MQTGSREHFIHAYTAVLVDLSLVSAGASRKVVANYLAENASVVVAAYYPDLSRVFEERAREFCLGIRNCQPPRSVFSAIEHCWPQGHSPRDIRALQPVIDAVVAVFRGAEMVPADGGEGRISLHEGMTRREQLKQLGMPTLPATSQGLADFDSLESQLLQLGLARVTDDLTLMLTDALWLKAPRHRSGAVGDLESLRKAYDHLVSEELAHLAVAELYIPQAYVICVDFKKSDQPDEDHSLSFSFFERNGEPKNGVNLLPIQRGVLATYIDLAIQGTGIIQGHAKFLCDPRTNSFYFMKIKPAE